MKFTRHVTDRLAPYVDGTLDGRARQQVDSHLAVCGDCRGELEQVQAAATALHQLPVLEAPESIWTAIEAADATRARSAAVPMWRYAAAAILVLAVLAGYWTYSRQQKPRWNVVAIDGRPVAGDRPIDGTRWVATGESVVTDAVSRARIAVGEIGTVEVLPNTQVRLVASGKSGYRLALSNGGIKAAITAPPRLFVLDTPAATAFDLGCVYEVHCDGAGTGTLTVSQGWVSLEWHGRESLIPAGASCHMRPGQGPGTPWFLDAAPEFAEALDRFDFAPTPSPQDLDTLLALSRPRDTLTLWHLLARADGGVRARVYERMVQFGTPPSGVTRDAVLRLDRQTLTRWKDELAWTW